MKRVLFLFLFVVGQVSAWAADPCFPVKPKDEEVLVYQKIDFLSKADVDRLNTKLARFAQETSNRIMLVVVGDLCGYPASDFAFRLGEEWGIGAKGVDNGIVFLVKPTGGPGDRHVFIATGYGLEGAIPDATAKQVVENEVLPAFRNGQFYAGIDQATTTLMGMAKKEIDVESYGKEAFPWQALVFMFVFMGFILWSFVSKANGYAKRNNVDFWTAWALMNAASDRHRGQWGGFSGGGGGFGGGGGGGFGGFGGGSFGGGGAGGSW